MTFEVALTQGGITFILLLLLMYLKKQTFKNARTNAYKILLVLCLSISFIEIGIIQMIDIINSELLINILWKSEFVLYLLFELNLCYYIISSLSDKEESKILNIIKDYNISKILLFIFITLIGLYIALPIEKINIEKINFIPGHTIYIYISSILLVIITTLINKNKKKRKYYLISSFIPVIIGLLQILFNQISFLPFGLILELYIIYFFIENPDIEIMEEISLAQGDIEQSSQTKSDFLSNMTTEIKVPMNLIVSLCDELETMPTFNEKLIREDISQIYSSGNSLLDIINNILDISKIETGKSTLQEGNYQVNTLITNILNITKSKIGAKQVKLLVSVDKNISSTLYGDYSKIYQILTNIVTNAAIYTEVGKITFTLTSTKTSGVETLLFKISDTGTGIKEEDQALLFQKGARLFNARQGEIDGSGLGLAISKEYIELLGGKIWFESQYRVGSTFYVEVPQKIIDSTPISVEEEKKLENIKLDCSKYKVLIVDDNNLNIKVAKRLLESYKFNVESVTSGKDCVYKIKEGIEYDAIFMDHMMPEMDGIETLHVLKKLTGYTLPPIIALTANAVAGMREMYLNEGFDEYLSKPINTSELDRVINLFFKK